MTTTTNLRAFTAADAAIQQQYQLDVSQCVVAGDFRAAELARNWRRYQAGLANGVSTGWLPRSNDDIPKSTSASTDGATFVLRSGKSGAKHDISVSATWGGGSVVLKLNGTTVFTWTSDTSLTAVTLLPGAYSLSITTATGVAFSLAPTTASGAAW